MNNIIKKMLDERQTVKAYSDKKIVEKDWKSILDTIYWAPSSLGFEPYRVLIINKESEMREKLFHLMWKQGTVLEADKLIFFISMSREAFTDEKFIKMRATRFSKKLLNDKGEKATAAIETIQKKFAGALSGSNYTDDWASKQAYIALGASMNTAALLGVGSTPMEGMEIEKVTKLFLDEGLMNKDERTSLAVAFGYPKSKSSYAHFGTGARLEMNEVKNSMKYRNLNEFHDHYTFFRDQIVKEFAEENIVMKNSTHAFGKIMDVYTIFYRYPDGIYMSDLLGIIKASCQCNSDNKKIDNNKYRVMTTRFFDFWIDNNIIKKEKASSDQREIKIVFTEFGHKLFKKVERKINEASLINNSKY